MRRVLCVLVLAAGLPLLGLRGDTAVAQDSGGTESTVPVCVGLGGDGWSLVYWTASEIADYETRLGLPITYAHPDTGTCQDPTGLPLGVDRAAFSFVCSRTFAGDWYGPGWVANRNLLGDEVPPDPTTGACPNSTVVRSDAGSSTARPTPSPRAGRSGCEPVPLYPGYPGYRGNVPGMLGAGDAACLSDLEAQDPTFSREDADNVNVLIAATLGIPGGIEEWTWETWMAIDAQRGGNPPCYACIWTNGLPPLPSPVAVGPTDPRVMLGGYGRQRLAQRFAADNGLNSMEANLLGNLTDEHLRALAGMANPGRYLTAQQVLDFSDAFFRQYDCLDGPPCVFANTRLLWDNLIAQGGYAPTLEGATEGDQFYMIAAGAAALGPLSPPHVEGILLDNITQLYDAWRLEGASRPSFGEYLRTEGAAGWL